MRYFFQDDKEVVDVESGIRETVNGNGHKVYTVDDEALKYDDGKVALSLVPTEAITGIASVLTFGARKYGAHNWRRGMEWTRLYDAAARHMLAWLDGEDDDPESGLSHLAHAASNIAFLLSYAKTGAGTDDRSSK